MKQPMIIHAFGANDGLTSTIRAFLPYADRKEAKLMTRTGLVLAPMRPMLVTVSDPCDNILTLPGRKATPYFWLYELMWMLAGLDTNTWLMQHLCPRLGEFANSAGRFEGGYGERWYQFLGPVVKHLQRYPYSRRGVIPHLMDDDISRLDGSKDVPCNTQIFLSRDGDALDMTVTNRSNDVVWGMWGSNFFIFSSLLRLVAGALAGELGQELRPGCYTVFSQNPHLYERHWRFLSPVVTDKWRHASFIDRDAECPTKYASSPIPKNVNDLLLGTAGLRQFLTAIDDQQSKRGIPSQRVVNNAKRTAWDDESWWAHLWEVFYAGVRGREDQFWRYPQWEAAHNHYIQEMSK